MDVLYLIATGIGISDHYLLMHSSNLSAADLTFITRKSHNLQDFDVDAFYLEVATSLGAHMNLWDNNLLDNLVDIFDKIMSILDRIIPYCPNHSVFDLWFVMV